MIPFVILAPLALQADTLPHEKDDNVRGTAGVCIRWGADPDHVAEAVVVVSSGNRQLDETLPQTIKGNVWPRPSSAKYKGGWIPMNLSINEPAPANRPYPNCDHLPGGAEPLK